MYLPSTTQPPDPAGFSALLGPAVVRQLREARQHSLKQTQQAAEEEAARAAAAAAAAAAPAPSLPIIPTLNLPERTAPPADPPMPPPPVPVDSAAKRLLRHLGGPEAASKVLLQEISARADGAKALFNLASAVMRHGNGPRRVGRTGARRLARLVEKQAMRAAGTEGMVAGRRVGCAGLLPQPPPAQLPTGQAGASGAPPAAGSAAPVLQHGGSHPHPLFPQSSARSRFRGSVAGLSTLVGGMFEGDDGQSTCAYMTAGGLTQRTFTSLATTTLTARWVWVDVPVPCKLNKPPERVLPSNQHGNGPSWVILKFCSADALSYELCVPCQLHGP